MSKKVTIQIRSEDLSVDVVTESEVTQHIIQRIEKNIEAIINRSITHDMRGRITSINMSLSMLERHVSPDGQRHVQQLKTQVEDLSRLLEVL